MFIYILCDLLFFFGVIFFYLTWLCLCLELCKHYYTTQNIQTKLPRYLLLCNIPCFNWMCEASGLMVLKKYYTVDEMIHVYTWYWHSSQMIWSQVDKWLITFTPGSNKCFYCIYCDHLWLIQGALLSARLLLLLAWVHLIFYFHFL